MKLINASWDRKCLAMSKENTTASQMANSSVAPMAQMSNIRTVSHLETTMAAYDVEPGPRDPMKEERSPADYWVVR